MAGGLSEIFRWHARSRPAKPAIIENGRFVDYRSLDRRIDGLCHALQRRGVGRGAHVGVGLDDNAEHVIALLAIARMGAVLIPIDRRWSAIEKSTVAAQYNAQLTLLARSDDSHVESALRPEADWFEESGEPYADPAVALDQPFVLSLSSGTTGLPKGPRLTQEQIVNRFMVYWIDLGFNSSDRFVSATPLYFGGGRSFAIAMLWAGATVDMFAPPYQPEALIAHVNEGGGTCLFLVPTLLRRLIALDGPAPAMPGLKVLLSSGSVLFGHELLEIRRKLNPNFFQYYASTEAGGVSILSPNDFAGREHSVGRPCFRVDVEVVDDNDRPAPRGAVGRLRYRSPASPTEFHVGETAGAFRDGFFYPGDLASIDAEGYVFLHGRSKDMIIRGGVNIYPNDIEQAIQETPGVVEAAVVGMPSKELGEEIAAFVATSRPLAEAALREACAARLAPFKVPKLFIFVDALPRNAGGKVLKKELQARLSS